MNRYWPAYFEKKLRKRNLAYLDTLNNKKLIREDGSEKIITDLEDLLKTIREESLDLYVYRINRIPFLKELLSNKYKTELYINNERLVIGLVYKFGRYHYWFGCSRSWGYLEPNLIMLKTLRAYFNHCRIGTRTTPSQVGLGIWSGLIKNKKGNKIPLPPPNLQKDLREGLKGGRVDTIMPNNIEKRIGYEIDMNDAYASVAGMGLPGGESINLWHGTDPREFNGIISGNKTLPPFDKLATYYTRVNIYIKKELPFGVIVNRDPTTGEPHWIKEPGLHEGVWAWKEEIDQACSMGCLVTSVGRAWGWTYLDHTSSKRWVLTMRYLRLTAPTADLQDLVKLAIVAALGSHARDRYKRIPCDLFESDYSFILDEDDPNEIPMGCKQIINKRSCNLNHWYSYIMAKTRVILLGRMLAELKLGNRIIRADYDAIILEDESKVEICPYHKDTTNEYQFLRNKINLFKQLELELGQPPTWKQRRLTNITIPYPRALISNEKTRLPGNIEFNTRKL